MKYLLISKINRTTRVMMTPYGVQIWMKGKQIQGASETCVACGKGIASKPFYVPMAGQELPNPTERIHATCMNKLELLPMTTNPFIVAEEPHNGEFKE
jgi:hypothetical protein